MAFSLVSLLLFVCVCVCSVTQSCPTLCDPVNYSLPGSSVHRISQAGILEWVAIAFTREFSPPRDQLNLPLLHCRQILYHGATGVDFLLNPLQFILPKQ